ncbi:hypothetical protein [Aliikangiella sp. G2MR2-5]|uniref:hypothetical protein n=1 Tax=Aliikangiella sp. G2MR2-5 TaxID=2788943 RepID=UPI001AEED47F|nr:hypothetical protein [Aliikangiella sp. G2MR2-5]
MIRSSPYHLSQNFHANLSQIRQWVLFQRSFCEERKRHIFYNTRGQFLGYIDNQESPLSTQKKLNTVREKLYRTNKVNHFVSGTSNESGYPFALNCNQPHADIDAAISRLNGINKEDRLWGTWDGLSAGTKSNPVPLFQLVDQVYQAKSQITKQSINASEFRHFLAQIIIESGAQKHSHSAANAIGLLQLRPEVLSDCQIPEKFYRHRMAQVDCAVRLFQQNYRNLKPAFKQVFGHLPAQKRDTLFSLLLTQSYHSGIGRILNLLTNSEFNKASLYFASHARKYTAQDIATGIIFHNMGRQELGLASLYYTVDVAIVAEKLCKTDQLKKEWFCI